MQLSQILNLVKHRKMLKIDQNHDFNDIPLVVPFEGNNIFEKFFLILQSLDNDFCQERAHLKTN